MMEGMGAGHFIFIPAVLLVGIVIGWILGSRAARDAFAVELKRREARDAQRRREVERRSLTSSLRLPDSTATSVRRQPLGQHVGQAGLDDLRLRGCTSDSRTRTSSTRRAVGVDDRERRARVAVARLADRSRVDQVAASRRRSSRSSVVDLALGVEDLEPVAVRA